MPHKNRRVALITGGSRGIGAETALALANHGYDIALTYRNKAARARDVVAAATQQGVRALAFACDMTHASNIASLFQDLKQWTDHLDVVVLNASGGLERELVAADPQYPMHLNRDAQLQFVDAALPLVLQEGVIVFVTSHWAHLYGQMEQLPAYEPIAESKHAGEQALRARQDEFTGRGIRLIVVTGDLIEGTITPKLLERTAPGLLDQQRMSKGALPTAAEMGWEIALAAMKADLPSGSTVVVGAPLQSMLSQPREKKDAEQLAALASVIEALTDRGIDYWLFGGWAVDFYAGKVTRPHDDVDLAVWLEDHDHVAELLASGGWKHAPHPEEDGGTGYERGAVRLELTFLLRGDDGAVFIAFRAGGVTWSKEPFGDDVAELGGVRARVIPLDVLRSGKSHPRDDASDAAKDRADSETLSRVR